MNDDGSADRLRDWQARLEAILPATSDGSHDRGHCRRVWIMASAIADAMAVPVDRLVLLAACFLHDLVLIEKNDPRRAQASRLAAEQARAALARIDFPRDRLDAVAHAIEAHSHSAGIAPRTVEARIVQDADRLEALGAIAVARTFYTAGRMNSAMFHPEEPLAQTRPLDDLRYALDHFETKLLRLPDTMQTEPGRRLARKRAEVLLTFQKALLDEVEPARLSTAVCGVL